MTASVWNQYLILLWNWVLGAQRRGAGGWGSGELNARVISAQNYERCFLFQTSQTADVQYAMTAIAVTTRSLHCILFLSLPVPNKADFIRLWKLYLMVLITDKNMFIHSTDINATLWFLLPFFDKLNWKIFMHIKDLILSDFEHNFVKIRVCEHVCQYADKTTWFLHRCALAWTH